MLSADGLSKSFDAISALHEVSIEVVPGIVRGLIGPNGAGKTTLINILTGYTKPDCGTVAFNGVDLAGLPPHQRARLGISRTFQTPRLLEDHTMEANICLGLPPGSANADPIVREISDMLGLTPNMGRIIAGLSAGECRLIEVARSLVGKPTTLLLDEPFAGLSAPEIKRVCEIIRTLSAKLRIAVLLIEHNLNAVFDVTDELSVLDRGRMVATGSTKSIADSVAVRKIFFGGASVNRTTDPRSPPVANNPEPALQARNLTAGYHRLPIVQNVNLTINSTETVGLLGVNGAGKTTLLRALAGTLPLSTGDLDVHGVLMTRKDVTALVRHGVILVPEGRRLFRSLTAEDNLRLAGTAIGLMRKQIDERLEELLALFPNIRELRHRHAGALSGGQQQSVAVARALMSRPRVLLLDEPSIGLSRPALDELALMLRHLIEKETISVLLAEQNLHFAGLLCDRSYLIDGGRIVAEGGSDLIEKVWTKAVPEDSKVSASQAGTPLQFASGRS